MISYPSTPPFTLSSGSFYKNISYGPSNLQQFDIAIPTGGVSSKPIVIYVHGGGYRYSNKESFYNAQSERDEINFYLSNDIIYCGIDYRLIKTISDSQGVEKCLDDGRLFMDFIIDNASYFNVDTTKMFLFGGSAGGGIIQDIAFSGLYSGILAIGLNEIQADTDTHDWNQYFTSINFDVMKYTKDNNLMEDLFSYYGIRDESGFESQRIQSLKLRMKTLDLMVNYNGKIYLTQNNWPNTVPTDRNHVLHHPLLAKAVYDRANIENIEIYAEIQSLSIGPKVEVTRQQYFQDVLSVGK